MKFRFRNVITILILTASLTTLSYGVPSDSTTVSSPTFSPQTRVPTVDLTSTSTSSASRPASGSQTLPSCGSNSTLVAIQNTAQVAYYGPAVSQTYCSSYGSCSGAGCWCAGSPHSCCVWCDPPCNGWTTVSMQWYTRSQLGSTVINAPSVLSSGTCAQVKGTWATAP